MPLHDGNKARTDLTNPSSGGSGSGTIVKGPDKRDTDAPRDGGGGGGGGGGQSAADAYAAAQRKANNKAAQKYADQVKILQAKVEPLLKLLNGGYMEALNKRLANTAEELGLKDAALLESYNNRVSTLDGSAEDNEKAMADTSYTNLANRGRERASAMNEALMQGAGESDVLKASLMSLRSWDANQNEANRAYNDTLRGINSSLTDLNVDTKTGRLNFASQAEADRDAMWTEYYNKMGETYTQLGNVRGEQASMYASAEEMRNLEKYEKGKKDKTKESKDAFAKAGKMSTQVYDRQGPSEELKAWKGRAEMEGTQSKSDFVNAKTTIGPKKKPEGATLRKWE